MLGNWGECLRSGLLLLGSYYFGNKRLRSGLLLLWIWRHFTLGTNVWGVGSYFSGVEGHLLWEKCLRSGLLLLGSWRVFYFGNKCLRRRQTFPKKEPTPWVFTLGTNTWGGGGHSQRKSSPFGRLLQERLRSRTFLKKEPSPRVFTLGTPEEEFIPKVSGHNLSSISKGSTALGLLRCSQSKCTLTPHWVSTYFRNASSPSPYTYRGSAP